VDLVVVAVEVVDLVVNAPAPAAPALPVELLAKAEKAGTVVPAVPN
jgi:hypothetical protein